MSWKIKDEKAICTLKDLKEYVAIDPKKEKKLQKVIKQHPMRITPYYASLIDWNDPDDPLRKMVVPDVGELNLQGSYDTSGEAENTKIPGLQHKYAQTVLFLVTNQCPVYCRYCFRKRLVGLQTKELLGRFNDAVEYIMKHKEINNVLISGGDPLVLETHILETFLEKLSKIPHLSFIRFSSRVPTTMPSRITDDLELLKLFKKYSKKSKRLYLVIQCNHPREITKECISAIDKVIKQGVIVNCQSILLKGVNDRPRILAELFDKLIQIGVNPYYLFQCRPVKRVKASFEESLYRGYHVVEGAKRRLNGHSKRFKYILSHVTGKIEIVGITEKEIFFKYHQAKNLRDGGRFFKCKLDKEAGWLDDLTEVKTLHDILQEKLYALFSNNSGDADRRA